MPKKTPRKPIVTRKQKIAAANSAEFSRGVDSSTGNVNAAEERLENPVQPEIDKNRYRVIKLCNGLTAVLISTDDLLKNETPTNDNGNNEKGETPRVDDKQDPRFAEFSDQFAKEMNKSVSYAICTLCLNVGSFSDPPDISGIARILSRVVLCSSTKYPQVESFTKFLLKHEGCLLMNHEHYEWTYFSFKLLTMFLSDALDRFTNCFVNPILRRDSIIAERDIIKKEYQRNRYLMTSLDQRDRLFSALSSGIKRYAGSAEGWSEASKLFCITKDALLAEVNKFMKRHYSANRMTVAIQASLPLDTLEEYTRKYFARIPNNGLPPVDLSSHSYLRFFNMSAFSMLYKMNPEPDGLTRIELNWPMPPVHGLYRSKPYSYIRYIIENKEEGSLIYYLRERNWCSRVETSVGKRDFENNTIYSLFTVSIHLLPDGHRYQKKIIDAVYSYLNFLKSVGPNKRIYDEVRRIAEGVFRTKVIELSSSFHVGLCKIMHLYPSVDYFGADLLCYEYDPEIIKACLDCMSPDRANLMVYGESMPELYWMKNIHDSDFEEEDEELCKFRRFEIPRDWKNEWMTIGPLECFKLPQPNIFCPDDFSLLPPVKDGPKYPVKVHSDALCEVWHKADDSFSTPECTIIVTFNSDIPLQSAETAAMLDLFSRAVARLVCEELCPAIAAGMTYAIEPDETSLSVAANGFNKKVQIVMHIIGKVIGCCSAVSKEFFAIIINEQLETYAEKCTDNESLAADVKRAILFPVYWTSADKIAALSCIEFEKFQYFTASYTSRVYVKSLVQGNIGESDAVEMVRSFVGLSKCGSISPENRPRLEVKEIPRGSSWCKVRSLCPHRTPDYAISYYQFGEKSLMINAAIDILRAIMKVFLFMDVPLYRGLDEKRLLVRLREACCNEYTMDATNEDCLASMLPELCIEKYRRHLYQIILGFSNPLLVFFKHTFLSAKPVASSVHFGEEIRRNWREIKTGEYMFDRWTREAEAMEHLDLQQLRNLLISLVSDDRAVRKLTIKIVGSMKCDGEHNGNNTRNIPRAEDMKIKLLSDSLEDDDKEQRYYIRDISSYKGPLNTIRARAHNCVDKIAADVEKSCKLAFGRTDMRTERIGIFSFAVFILLWIEGGDPLLTLRRG